jgi:uroporphyrinogen-III synthase
VSENSNAPGILILRPVQQATATIDAINGQGWHAIHFPTVVITPAASFDSARALEIINSADWIIFISQNAVLHFLELCNDTSIRNKKIAAVGHATAQLLQENGLDILIQPRHDFSSEGLLDSADLSTVSGQNIVIVRGNGGREMLAEAFRERGASVNYLEVYERQLADSDPAQLLPLWPENIRVIVATSNQLLDNLVTLCRDLLGDRLFHKPVVVLSERMRLHAHKIGFRKIWLAERSSNDEIIKTIDRNIAPPQNQL